MIKDILLFYLLKFMVNNKGSDLHISSGSPPMIRINGEMVKVNKDVFKPEEVESLILPVLSDAHTKELNENRATDFSFTVDGHGIFRANVFHQRKGLSFVLRLLPENPPTLAELNMPEALQIACHHANGLILVTGPTGSGKSTTLAAMLNYINTTRRGHIITIEDPVEFIHETNLCMINQRSMGSHFTGFSSALRSALREDPDYILVGEMRDLETMSAAIHAAETGHLVFSTLHTNSAEKTVDRIINSFPSGEQNQVRMVLSETLRTVISQKLIPNKDRTKRICFQDILVVNDAVSSMIREGKTHMLKNAMELGKGDGMLIMDEEIRRAVETGNIRASDARDMANNKKKIEKSPAYFDTNDDIRSFFEELKGKLGDQKNTRINKRISDRDSYKESISYFNDSFTRIWTDPDKKKKKTS